MFSVGLVLHLGCKGFGININVYLKYGKLIETFSCVILKVEIYVALCPRICSPTFIHQ